MFTQTTGTCGLPEFMLSGIYGYSNLKYTKNMPIKYTNFALLFKNCSFSDINFVVSSKSQVNVKISINREYSNSTLVYENIEKLFEKVESNNICLIFFSTGIYLILFLSTCIIISLIIYNTLSILLQNEIKIIITKKTKINNSLMLYLRNLIKPQVCILLEIMSLSFCIISLSI